MESTENKIVRYKLAIAKVQVSKLEKGELGCKFQVMFKEGMSWTVDLSFVPDVRIGDIYTIYMEIPAHAQPSTTSLQ
jgi:hypothetical protein